MEWERAKTYLLIFFLLLNIALAVLLTVENRRYTLTGDQDALIRTVLNQHNIGVYRIDIRRFPPMRPLEVTGFYYDTDALLQILFEHPHLVVQSERGGRKIFQYGYSVMEISNGFVDYINPYGFRQKGHEHLNELPIEITFEKAEQLTNLFIDYHFPDFVLDGSINERDGIRLIYRQEHRGMLIHSNFIQILVTSIGIHQIEMQFGQILGHTGTTRAIFSPDEALLAFAQRIRHIAIERPMIITRMDLVYFQEYISDQPIGYHAVPFYRIFTEGNDAPFLINAFTNTMID